MELIVTKPPLMKTGDVTEEDECGAISKGRIEVICSKGMHVSFEPSIVGLWLSSTPTTDLEPQILDEMF